MLTKKLKRNIIFVLAAALLCSVTALMFLPEKSVKASGDEPLFVYDFSQETMPDGYDKAVSQGTGVKISSAVGTATATLYSGTTNGSPDSYVENGKLVFNQRGTANTNGYLVVSENALSSLNNWTLSMKISDMAFGDSNTYNLLSITQKSPLETDWGSDNQGIMIHNSIESDNIYKLYIEKTNPGWVCGNTNALFYTEDGILTVVYDGNNVLVYINGVKTISLTVGENYFADKSFIKIGGYVLSWGRNVTVCSVDDITLYSGARTDAQIKADYDKAYPVEYKTEKRAEIYYDFASATDDGVVANKGTAANSDGRIVAKNVDGVDDVYVDNGKLVINNAAKNDKEAGYFRLPDEMFAGKTEWSIQMSLSNVNISDYLCGFMSFNEKDPSVVPIVEDAEIDAGLRYDADGKPFNTSSHVFWFWNSTYGWSMYSQASYGDTGSRKSYATSKGNPVKADPKVFTMVYKKGVFTCYCEGNPVFATQTNASISANHYERYEFNKIGGYLYSWGRSAAQITVSDFAFYGYALNMGEMSAESDAIVSAYADLGSDATELKAIGITRGGKQRELIVADKSGIDFATLGEKQFAVYDKKQYSPVVLTLLTRDLTDYNGEITLDPTDSLPTKVEATYTDGNKAEVGVVWGDYAFAPGEQTISGTLADDAGRTANATLKITGKGFEWSKVQVLLDKIAADEAVSVKSTYTAMMTVLQPKIDHIKTFENDQGNDELATAYAELAALYEAEKGKLVAVKPITDALEKYEFDAFQIIESYKTEYEAAYAALNACKEVCENDEARDAAIERVKAAYELLYVSPEYIGLSGSEISEEGNVSVKFESQPKAYWGKTSFTNVISGDYYAEFTVNEPMDYVVGDGADVSIIVKTQQRYVTYRLLKNVTWDADCITRCFNVKGWTAEATNVAVDGVFPEIENHGKVWSADKFDMLQPYTVKVWRVAEDEENALYYIAVEQEGTIRHAFYDRLADLTDVRIGFAARNCSVKLEGFKFKGVATPFEGAENADYYLIDGTAAVGNEGVYDLGAEVMYSGKTLSSANSLYSFDLKAVTAEDGAESTVSIGFAQKNGFIANRINLTFATDSGDGNVVSVLHLPVYDIDIGLFEASVGGNKYNFAALETNKNYKIAVLVSASAGEKRNLKVYVLNGENIIIESKELSIESGDFIPALSAKNGNFEISKIEAKDLGNVVSADQIDETLYSTASVEAYKNAMKDIDFGIITLINATESELNELRTAAEEAKKLLKLTRIIQTVDEFQKIIVKQNAKKVVLPLRVKVKYDNGQTKNVLVEWETPDTSKAGDLNIKGVIKQPDGSDYLVYYPVTVKADESGAGTSGNKGGCFGVLGGDFALISVCLSAFAAIGLLKKKRNNG